MQSGELAGMVIALVIGVIVFGTIYANTNTDAIMGSSTAKISSLSTIVLVAFTLAGVGIIALVGKYIINVFS